VWGSPCILLGIYCEILINDQTFVNGVVTYGTSFYDITVGAFPEIDEISTFEVALMRLLSRTSEDSALRMIDLAYLAVLLD